jgi:hypothetical protein
VRSNDLGFGLLSTIAMTLHFGDGGSDTLRILVELVVLFPAPIRGEQRRAITIANADPDVLRVIRNGESHRHFRSPHRAEWRQV